MPISNTDALTRTIDHREIFHDEMLSLARLDVDDGRPTLLEGLHLAPELAALRRADQPADESAVKRDDELRQGRRNRQHREADEDANRDGQRVMAGKRAENSGDLIPLDMPDGRSPREVKRS